MSVTARRTSVEKLDADTALRLSGFAIIAPAGRRWIVANVAAPSRMVVDEPIAKAVRAFDGGPLTAGQFAARCPEGLDANALLSLLVERAIVVAEDDDEVAGFDELIATGEALPSSEQPPPGPYQTPRVLHAAHIQGPGGGASLRPLDVLLVGGCVVAFAQDTLVRRGLQLGFSVTCRHRWPSPRGLAPLREDGAQPDLVVLQASIQSFLAGVWDDGPFQTPAMRARHARALARLFTRLVDELGASLEGQLGLVHNLAPPSVSPFGRLDFRTPGSYREILAEINAAIDDAARRHEHVMVLDEERLALRHGGERLFDELLFPFGHHGGAADPRIAQPHQLPALSEALAEEYLACYEVFHGLRRIRCVAVDLDGVLWPGILAEDGMGWIDSDTTTSWLHQGLHQALRLLESRGILLMSLSKGSAEITLGAWRDGADSRLLHPDQFVLHSIEWTPKPERLQAIAQRLGIQLENVLFLDDSPSEQAEMSARLPDVQILEGEVASFRARLLSDPRCEVSSATPEAARRTATTRMALAREGLRDTLSAEGFLSSLDVRVGVEVLGLADRPRMVELLTRTTQFNTLGRRLPWDEATSLIEGPGVTVAGARVRDRFGEHGLCGIVVVEGEAVVAVVLSCRVIGLDIAVAMLVASLRLTGRLCVGTSAHVEKVLRNAPCHDLFVRAGFADRDDGCFEILDPVAVEQSARPEHIALAIGAEAAAGSLVGQQL